MIPLSFFSLLLLFSQLGHCQYLYKELPKGDGHMYSVARDMMIHFNYQDSSGEWRFSHNDMFQLTFISVEFNTGGFPCRGKIEIWFENQERYINCDQNIPDITYRASRDNWNGHYTMRIHGDLVNFRAIISLSSFADSAHENRHENIYVVYSFQQRLRSDNRTNVYPFSPILDYVEANTIETGEIISFDDFYWGTDQDKSQLPIADVPSCNADMPITCQWISTVSPDYYNHITNISGMAFKVASNVVVFETQNNTLYLEKICINIMYMSNENSVLKIYVRQRDERKGLEFVSSSLLAPEEYLTNRRIVRNVPVNLKGIPLQIVIQISASNKSPTYIKRIYGCNPYTIENRYEAPFITPSHSLTSSLNISGEDEEGDTTPAISHRTSTRIVFTLKGLVDGTYVVTPFSFTARKELQLDGRCLNNGRLDGHRCVCPAGFIGDRCQIDLVDGTNAVIPFSLKALKELQLDGRCLNDGRLDGHRCVCPAGFIGDQCHIGCGENKFGPRCESRCSLDENKCKGKVICRPNLGCSCAPGLRGTYCNVGCSDYWYGAGCRSRCGQCRNYAPCDHFTGVCNKGCQPRYVPPLCQSKENYITEKPTVSEIDYNSVVFSVNITTDTHGDIRFYTVQYKNFLKNIDDWFKTPIRQWPDDSIVQEKLLDLKAGSRYWARLVVFNEEMSSYEGDDLPTVQFETPCVDNVLNITEQATETEIHLEWEGMSEDVNRCESKYYYVEILLGSKWKRYTTDVENITITSLLPGTEYIIRIRGARENSAFYFKTISTLRNVSGIVNNLIVGTRRLDSIELLWGNDTDKESVYFVEYQCLTILANQEDCQTDKGSLNVQRNRVVIEGLYPFRKYQFSVKELPGSDHSEVVSTTKPTVPDVRPDLLSVSSSNSSVIISWTQPTDCSKCNGFITGYSVKVSGDGNNTVAWEETKTTKYEVKHLAPGTLYKLHINMHNTEGKSTVPLIVEAVTKSTVPSSVVDLVVYKTGRREVGLRWSRPRQLFGELAGFRLDAQLIPPTPCPAWPSQYCHTLTGLTPDTTYNFSVCAKNDKVDDDGMYSFISATTVERAPEEPINLTVYNETGTSITVSWEPPRLFNGILRSFLIKVEQTESFKGADCCQYFPKTEIKVNNEQPLYESQISGLSEGSTFAVSVMGETVWLGPAARKSVCTRPPSPGLPTPPSTLTTPTTNDTLTLDWPQVPHSDGSGVSELIQDNLVLVLPVSNETPMNATERIDDDLKVQLGKAFPKQRYYIGARYERNEERVEVEGLVGGHRYSLAVVAVTKYCHLYSISSLASSQFMAP